nr:MULTISPECIES: DUF4870 domain-containing protein [unclassified Ornithinimicrobium]
MTHNPYPQQPPIPQPGDPRSYSAAPDPANGEERTMMLLAHLSAPAAMLLSVGWLPFLGPLLVWLFYRERSAAVRTAAAGAFNFNLTMTIASVLTWISVFVTLGIGLIWAVPIWIVLFIVQIVVHVRGALAASRGEVYNYPLQIRLLS